jgi:hypothetical protein
MVVCYFEFFSSPELKIVFTGDDMSKNIEFWRHKINNENCFIIHLDMWSHLITDIPDLNTNKVLFTAADKNELGIKERKFKNTILFHPNSLLNYNLLDIKNIEKKYDAIYIARSLEWKNHSLTTEIKNKIFVVGPSWVSYKEIELDQFNPIAIFKNVKLPELSDLICSSYCGLCLSDVEGGCFSSSEYLLSGIPVISIPELGGRSYWYDNNNSIICQRSSYWISKAVKFIKENYSTYNPHSIRNKHIEMQNIQRDVLINFIQRLFSENKIEIDAHRYFNEKLKENNNMRKYFLVYKNITV